jgi:hypothetical protein
MRETSIGFHPTLIDGAGRLLAPRAMDRILRNIAIPALRLAERVGLG